MTKAQFEEALRRERAAHRQTAAALTEAQARLTEALDGQTATSEILRVIANSPTDVRPAFAALAASAADLCDAYDAVIFHVDGHVLRLVAHEGPVALGPVGQFTTPLARGYLTGRVALDRRTIQIADHQVEGDEYPEGTLLAQRMGVRTMLGVPLLRAGEAIGVIALRRSEVRLFSDREIDLLQTFADQAVIAIENVRLFTELQTRNADLTEALDRQTATSEILRIISSSRTDVQPVFDTIAASASRLCGDAAAIVTRFDGEMVHLVAHHNPRPGIVPATARLYPRPLSRDTTTGRAILEGRIVHIPDAAMDQDLAPNLARDVRAGSFLAVPMLRDGRPIGAISVSRAEAGAFPSGQITLLQTFADQAVIAIENVRLFTELQASNRELTRALETQTATSDILGVISRSQTDVQPVFDAILASAVDLLRGESGALTRVAGDQIELAALTSADETAEAAWRARFPRPLHAPGMHATAMGDRAPLNIADSETDARVSEAARAVARLQGFRSWVVVPLLRQHEAIGTIAVNRREPGGFAADEIALLETFADQAVIAIENARLLGELQEKNRALTEAHERVSEALDRQTATSEILRVISQSPTDVRPVFDVILESAVPLCSARFGVVYRYDGELIHIMAHHNFSPEAVALLSRDYPAPPGGGTVSARAIAEREVVQIYDSTDPARAPRKSVDIARALQYRAMVSVPMLRDGQPIGAITLARREAGAFSDTHIAMLRTFADQAVIAIENVRLFTELQQKNSALTDALGQQTATADILGVISRSPTDAQPVFEAIVSSAVRLCEGTHGAVLRVNGDVIDHVAAFAHDPAVLDQIRSHYPRRLSEVGPGAGFRALRERRVVEIADIDIAPDVADFIRQTARRMGFRSEVWMPMLRGEETLGAIGVTRREPGGFSTNQIALLRSFADQAVIAIENVRLFTELQEKNRAVTEALDQQSATSEVLRVISGSPTDLRPVFDAILARALRLCGGLYGGIFMIDTAGHIDLVAHTEVNEDAQRAFRAYFPRPVADLEWGSYIAGVVRDGMTVHVADVLADSTANDAARALARSTGYRAVLFVPFVRNGRTIGLLSVTRAEPEPFTPAQVALIESFAAQGLIAIENVRLFTELQERNRALTQALDEQTATGNILRVISGSPTDIRPVFQAIMDSAARLLRAHSGAVTRVVEDRIELVALTASDEAAEAVLKANYPMTLDSGTSHALTIQSRRPFNVHDCETDPRLTDAGRRTARARGYRSQLLVPMLRHDQPLGAISLTRREPGGFKDEEIALLQTFADQAVIAIENVRLFTELQASNRELTTALDTQTATSDILRVISRSQTDVQPVFQTIVDSAERLLRGNSAVLSRIAGDRIELAAFTHTDDGGDALLKSFFPMSLQSSGAETRPIRDRVIGAREPYNVADMEIDPRVGERGRANARARGYRSQLVVPMLRHDEPIGTIAVTRPDPGAFTEDEIALLTTFADQAVIAIENARLFTELQEKNRALTDALDQQTATGEILRVISESPTDVQPVFDAIVRNAGRVCDANDAALFVVDGDVIVQTAHWGPIDTLGQGARVPLTRTTGAGRAVLDTVTVHVTDLASDPDFPEGREFAARFGYRTIVAVPLIREAKAIGALLMRRTDVRLFTDKQIEMLRLFADQAVIAIENVRLFAELQARTHDLTRSVDQLTALGEVSRAVSSTLDLDRVLDTVVNRATQLAGADGCSIWEYDADVDGFRMRATSQISGELVDRQRAIPVRAGEGAVGRLRETRAPVQIPDITVAEAYRGSLRDTLVTGGFRALLAVPMIQEDRVVGGLVVSRKTSGEFPPETVELLQTFANQSALAIANARLFREIEEKSAQLEVANQHKSEFLANMSHELRTPLNAVIGFSDVLLEGMFGEINEKQTEYLRDILSSGTHLLSLINDILDLSKIEAGRMELDLTDFDVPSAIGNALTLMRERASRHGIVLTQMVDSGLGEIRADERKFKQVLLNLLSNAVKFTPSGGKVEVRARHHDGMVEVAVADTGEGIALEDQQAVFEEFRQVGKTSKKIEGTGLGLALCRKFVELHGGTLGVESQVGVGSTFTFTLPVLESRPVDHGAARLRGGGDDHG